MIKEPLLMIQKRQTQMQLFVQFIALMTIHLLLCGADKGLELNPFFEEILPDLESIIVFGDMFERAFKAIKKCDDTFLVTEENNGRSDSSC